MPGDKVKAFINSYDLFEKEKVEKNSDAQLIADYYSVINYLCAIGEVEKMYIPPLIDNTLGIFANQMLFEEKMVRDLGLKPTSKVLDLGCGRGRVAAHVSQASGGASVCGINIDRTQIERAEEWAKANEFLSKRLSFKLGNFNDPLPYPDQAFDAMYQIQVLTYATSLEVICKEFYRVLKPGARLSFLDWVKLPKYDPDNEHHMRLIRRIKPLIGAVNTPSPKDFEDALEKAGFVVKFSGDASVSGHQAELIEKACFFFETFTVIINTLVAVRIIPQHFKTLFDRLTKDGDAFIEADKMGIFTTSYQLIAEKPL
jgi:sterol 24-C-methyltransferase